MLFKETDMLGFRVSNRIMRSATHDGLADENGAPTDKLIEKICPTCPKRGRMHYHGICRRQQKRHIAISENDENF